MIFDIFLFDIAYCVIIEFSVIIWPVSRITASSELTTRPFHDKECQVCGIDGGISGVGNRSTINSTRDRRDIGPLN